MGFFLRLEADFSRKYSYSVHPLFCFPALGLTCLQSTYLIYLCARHVTLLLCNSNEACN